MIKSKDELKTYFETGDKPTQEQYEDLIDSFIDAKQPASTTNQRFVINTAGEVTLQPDITFEEIGSSFYEENTWTPQVFLSSTEGTLTVVHAHYIRTGNLVYINMHLKDVNPPNEEGLATISLPPDLPAVDTGAIQVSLAKSPSGNILVTPDEAILEARCANDKIKFQDKYGRSIYYQFNNAELMLSGTYQTNQYMTAIDATDT